MAQCILSLSFVYLFVCLFVGETVTSHGWIEPDKDNIREEPYSLPQGFSWDALDLGNAAVVQHSNHYIYPSNSYTYKYTPGKNSSKALFHFFFSLWSWKSCTLSSMRTTWRMMTTCFVSITLLNFCFGKNDWLEKWQIQGYEKRDLNFFCLVFERLSIYLSISLFVLFFGMKVMWYLSSVSLYCVFVPGLCVLQAGCLSGIVEWEWTLIKS